MIGSWVVASGRSPELDRDHSGVKEKEWLHPDTQNSPSLQRKERQQRYRPPAVVVHRAGDEGRACVDMKLFSHSQQETYLKTRACFVHSSY